MSTYPVAAVTGRPVRSRRLTAMLALVVAGAFCGAPRAFAQYAPVETIEGTLPDGMTWRVVMPESGWNGTLLLDLDFVTGGVRSPYPALYDRGFAAGGVQRIAFDKGGRDSRVSARQLMEVLDVFTERFGKPPYVIMNGGSSGGVVSGYTLEHYPDRVDGAVAHCTVPGYIPYLNPRLGALFAAQVLLDIDLPIVSLPVEEGTAKADAWRAAIDAAQETPEGKARIALSLALGQMNSWTSITLPAPDLTDPEQIQAYMYDALRNHYANDQNPRRNQEQQVDGKPFNWTTGFDYAKIFEENVRPEQKATVTEYYDLAGLDLQADLKRVNDAPRIAADPAAVAEIHAHGDYSARPTKPFLMHNLIGDPYVQPAANQGYIDTVTANGGGDLVRAIHVEGAGHCAFKTNEYVTAIEVLDQRVRTGTWPGLTAAELNARASTVDATTAPRFIEYVNPPFAGGFWTGDTYDAGQ